MFFERLCSLPYIPCFNVEKEMKRLFVSRPLNYFFHVSCIQWAGYVQVLKLRFRTIDRRR